VTTGETLREARRRKKLTQQQLAEELDVRQPTIAAWESDLALPRPRRWKAVAKAYGVRVDVFLPKAA
jgi:transcriptional regulator with XRE-family HTH domain